MCNRRYIVYCKGPDRYVYCFDYQSRASLTQLLCKQAADPKLNLTWYDAALIVRTAKNIFIDIDREKLDPIQDPDI